MRHMPAIPEPTRSSIILRLLDHAEKNWPQLAKVRARYHGSFAYITGVLRNGEQIPLFRLRYGGSAHSFGFAIYSAARARHEDAVLLTGSPVGTPQEALDTACIVHLAGPGHEPPANLRGHPLKCAARRGWGRGWRAGGRRGRCVRGDGCTCAARGQAPGGVRFLSCRGGRRPIRRPGWGGSARPCRWSAERSGRVRLWVIPGWAQVAAQGVDR
jgi:hypothetical protein